MERPEIRRGVILHPRARRTPLRPQEAIGTRWTNRARPKGSQAPVSAAASVVLLVLRVCLSRWWWWLLLAVCGGVLPTAPPLLYTDKLGLWRSLLIYTALFRAHIYGGVPYVVSLFAAPRPGPQEHIGTRWTNHTRPKGSQPPVSALRVVSGLVVLLAVAGPPAWSPPAAGRP